MIRLCVLTYTRKRNNEIESTIHIVKTREKLFLNFLELMRKELCLVNYKLPDSTLSQKFFILMFTPQHSAFFMK